MGFPRQRPWKTTRIQVRKESGDHFLGGIDGFLGR